MNCIRCKTGFARVIDTRERRNHVARRRECDACKYRFTTHERYVSSDEIREQKHHQGRALAREWNGKPKPRNGKPPRHEPDPAPATPAAGAVSVWVRVQRWGLGSLTDLSQAGVELGLERGVVLEAVQRAQSRDEALAALMALGVVVTLT